MTQAFEPLQHFEQALAARLPAAGENDISQLAAAMRYAVLGPGKRIRPLLIYATGTLLDIAWPKLDSIACAVEMIHAYSLIHDDLPAMDDDDLRRGRPTTHVKFGVATAILAGDALQAQAFELLATDPTIGDNCPQVRANLMATLTQACGTNGMVGGQMLDIASENKTLNQAELEQIHALKTGALLKACLVLPTHFVPNLSNKKRQALHDFGKTIGLAFQVCDDILDITSTTEQLGKNQGADLAHNKATYPALMGLEAAKDYAQSLYQESLAHLAIFGEQAQNLRELAKLIVERSC